MKVFNSCKYSGVPFAAAIKNMKRCVPQTGHTSRRDAEEMPSLVPLEPITSHHDESRSRQQIKAHYHPLDPTETPQNLLNRYGVLN